MISRDNEPAELTISSTLQAKVRTAHKTDILTLFHKADVNEISRQ